jgi:DNA-binding response OmpR family regulator
MPTVSTMANAQQRGARPDRRRVPRGGRRNTDRPGRYPPILVADSYDGARRPCARYLDRFHFQVAEASHGEEALSFIIALAPHVILADSSLPTMPAWRLKQWLAQNWRTRNIPVIVMANDLAPDDADLREKGGGVLVKPFALTTMLAEVRRVLRNAANH